MLNSTNWPGVKELIDLLALLKPEEKLEETNIPPRSLTYTLTFFIAMGLGIIDAVLLLQFSAIAQIYPTSLISTPLIAALAVSLALTSLTLLGHLKVKYTLTDDRLIIKRLFSREVIPLENIRRVTPNRLGRSMLLLEDFNPSYTIRDGLLIETLDGKKHFISPSNREDFAKKIKN